MSDLRFDININEITEKFTSLKENISADIKKGVGSVASMTHAKVMELATNELNSLQKIYTDSLSFSNPEENLWIVSLDMKKAGWIEDGRKSGSMIDDLLQRNFKTSKDGNKYRVIPFEHSKPPSQQSQSAKDLTNLIKGELKQREISYKKIEYKSDGSPRIGLLHKFNVDNPRMSSKQKDYLQNVAVYQRKTKDGGVRRDVMTFRVVSEKQKADGKWVHPGRQADKFMDRALDWAIKTFDNEILPQILAKYE